MTGAGEVQDTPLEIKDKTLFFRGKPVVTLEGGYSFFFMERDGIEYWLNQVIDPSGEITTQWVKHEEDKDPVFLARRYVTLKGLEDTHKTRDNHLIDKITKEGIGKDEVNTFFDEIGPFIQINNLNKPPGDLGPGGALEEPPESFQDYPENIQRGALKVIEDPKWDVLKFLKGVISEVHIGDDPEIEFNILKEFSLHVEDGETVNIRIMGDTDTGKTDLTKKVLNIVPTRWQQDLTSVSPKFLYYANTLREDYNHIVFNDIMDNLDMLPLLKIMTDNLQDRKKHKTVIEKQAVEMEIPGKNTVTITAKKDINDPETERRFLHLNPQEDPDHKKEVKEHIKRMGIHGAPDSSLKFKICQAIFDKLTDTPFKVFNPWIECLEVDDLGNTDIKIFIGLVKARALIYQEDREKIGNDTLLGTRGDVEEVLKLWFKIAPLQQFKINKKQVELLKELPVYDEDIYKISLREMKEEDNTTLEGVTGKTLNELAQKIGYSRNSIRNWIYGEKGKDKPGLEDLGFTITKSSNPEKKNSPLLLYLNPQKKDYVKSLKEGVSVVSAVNNKIDSTFEGLEGKRSIIYYYLLYVNKLQVSIGDICKNPLFEKLSSTVKTDKEVHNIICSTIEALKTVEVEERDPVDNIVHSPTSGKIDNPSGTMEEPLNEDKDLNPLSNPEIYSTYNTENGKEGPKTKNLLTVDKLLQYIKDNPNNLEALTLELSQVEDTEIKTVENVIKLAMNKGLIRDPGTGILEVVED